MKNMEMHTRTIKTMPNCDLKKARQEANAIAKDMTKVIFRKFKNGEVIALFPQEPATRDGWECMSYMHVGQHGSADPNIVHGTRPAMPYEYACLSSELKSIGYNGLAVCKRFNKNDYKTRQERARL